MLDPEVVKLLQVVLQPTATLIAGLVGLSAIAYQTRKGFGNLIRSQEHKAELDRAARLHMQELAISDRAEQDVQKAMRIAAAIQGELEGLSLRYEHLSKSLTRSADILEINQSSGKSFVEQSLEIKKFTSPVIEAHLSEISYLNRYLIRDLSYLYAKISFDIGINGMKNYTTCIKHYNKCSDFYASLSSECRELSARINAYCDGREIHQEMTLSVNYTDIFND